MYQFTNNAKTTLASGLASGGTSISVTTGSVFPTEGNFRVTIWSSSYGSPGLDANAEIIEVSSRSSNTLTVLDSGRGLESTSDLTHSSGSNIALTLTAGVLERIQSQPQYVIAKDGTGDYNCTGTDHTGDDQTVINSAIDEIPSGSVVTFKPGSTFYLKGKGKSGAGALDWGCINIPKTLHIRAYGAIFDNQQGETTLTDEDDEYTVCFEWYSDNACDNSSWFGGKFIYTDRTTLPTAGGGAIWIRPKDASGNLYKGSNIRVKDINVEVDSSVVFGTYGVYNQQCNDVKIDSCTFKNTNSSAITYDGESTDSDNLLNMKISNCEFNGCARGIRHNNTDCFFRGIVVSNCTFSDCLAPIFIGVAKNVCLSNIVIENSTGNAVTLGIASSTENTLENIEISNIVINNVETTDTDGIQVNNINNRLIINGATIKNANRYAINLLRLKTKNVILDNIHIDQTDTADGWGIFSYSDTGVEKDTLQISNATIYPKKGGIKVNGYEDVQLSNIIIDGSNGNDNDSFGIQMMSSVTDANLSNVKVKNWDDSGTGADFIFQNSGSVNQSNVNDKNGNTKTTKTLAASATTFEVTSDFMVITGDSGANTIGTITGGIEGQELRLLFVDNKVTITDTDAHTADTIDLSASFTSADDTVLKLLYDGTSWYEVSRSVN